MNDDYVKDLSLPETRTGWAEENHLFLVTEFMSRINYYGGYSFLNLFPFYYIRNIGYIVVDP